ncbi:hypothetical protein [Xenorhabdus bovienii]|uniref:hypothetical protein n=1 Tax=Xenorhabdus bovienii TaxID=40576 RepID=UPI000570C6EF|nr:hypothetical protein [Xenorhabdus bovienii]
MNRLMVSFVFLLLSVFIPSAQANVSHDDSHGNAKQNDANGKAGMNGCDGGTNPSSDGKFYLPGTHQECNPGDADAKKVKKPVKT